MVCHIYVCNFSFTKRVFFLNFRFKWTKKKCLSRTRKLLASSGLRNQCLSNISNPCLSLIIWNLQLYYFFTSAIELLFLVCGPTVNLSLNENLSLSRSSVCSSIQEAAVRRILSKKFTSERKQRSVALVAPLSSGSADFRKPRPLLKHPFLVVFLVTRLANVFLRNVSLFLTK